MSSTSAEMRLRGRIGGNAKWKRVDDRSAATAPGRAAAQTALNRKIIEELNLDESSPSFMPRLEAARREHFARLALRSAQARRKGGRG